MLEYEFNTINIFFIKSTLLLETWFIFIDSSESSTCKNAIDNAINFDIMDLI